MSSKLHGMVWECDIQPLSRKSTLARLADYSNDEGYCFPSVETIRWQIGAKSKNTVITAVKSLIEEGWLTKVPRKIGGRDTSNAYYLNVEKIETASREFKKAKLKGAKFNPSNYDASKNDNSENNLSNSESSIKGELGVQNLQGEGATIEHDPLIESITDPSDKNPCQVASQPDDTNPAKIVLDHFNQKTNSSYRDGKTTMGYIRGRLAEPEYVTDDLILVVDYLTAKWLEDPKMCDYLRPSTIFGPENFTEYFQKAQTWQRKGRPACVNGKWQHDVMHIPSADYEIPDGWKGA